MKEEIRAVALERTKRGADGGSKRSGVRVAGRRVADAWRRGRRGGEDDGEGGGQALGWAEGRSCGGG